MKLYGVVNALLADTLLHAQVKFCIYKVYIIRLNLTILHFNVNTNRIGNTLGFYFSFYFILSGKE